MGGDVEPADARRGGAAAAVKTMSVVLTALLVLGASAEAVVAYDRLVVAPMREQLRNPLVDRALLEKVLEAAKEGRATPERPLVVNVAPQGAPATVQPVPVQVFMQPPPPLPYHLGLTARASTAGSVALGLRYVNRLGSGFYEVEPMLRYDMRLPPERRLVGELWLTYVVPFR